MRYLAFVLSVILFTGCSFKSVPNKWEHTVKNATSEFTKNFLEGHDVVALNDYNRAVDNAKMSADLTALGIVELTHCALNIIVGNQLTCEKFQTIENIIHSQKLSAYKYFITHQITQDKIAFLDTKYQLFAQNLIENKTAEAILHMQKTDNLVSKLLMASLIKDDLSAANVKELIDLCSYHGYKKATLFWLKFNYEKFNDETSLQTLKVLSR